MSPSGRTSADASTIMTRRNYRGPSLLKTIKGRSISQSPESKKYSEKPKGPTNGRQVDVDVLADPLSSSEEEHSPKESDSKLETFARSLQASKMSNSPVRNSRTSKRKSADPSHPSALGDIPPSQLSRSSEFDMGGSQSKKRKINQTYSARGLKTVAVTKKEPAGPIFNNIPALPGLAEDASSSLQSYNIPEAIPITTNRKKRSLDKSYTSVDVPTRIAEPQPTVSFFSLPEPTILEPTSSSTTCTTFSQVFDVCDLPAERQTRKRSGSTSSLSSLNSLESVDLTPAQKDALLHDDSNDGKEGLDTARCPLCAARVERSFLEEYNYGRRLNVRAQQRFCQAHKKRDADQAWKGHGYPIINWKDLETSRIPHHIGHLTKILHRERPSYYRTKLEEASKASRKSLQQYLKDDIVDIVKHGYYGPKGARIMGHEITTRMADVLKQDLTRSKVTRLAGFGGYVNAVLVPELTLRLVMEDMHVQDQTAALKILAESTELGMLVNGDEDESMSID